MFNNANFEWVTEFYHKFIERIRTHALILDENPRRFVHHEKILVTVVVAAGSESEYPFDCYDKWDGRETELVHGE